MLPGIVNGDGITKSVQIAFGGYDRRPEAADGTFRDTEGLTSEYYPLLRAREPFRFMDTRDLIPGSESEAAGILSGDELIWTRADGTIFCRDWAMCRIEPGQKQMVRFGKRAVIWPDKLLMDLSYSYLGRVGNRILLNNVPDPQEGDVWLVGSISDPLLDPQIYMRESNDWVEKGRLLTPMEAEVEAYYVYFNNGIYQDTPAEMNTLRAIRLNGDTGELVNWTGIFKPGDAVTISGCTKVPENNQTLIIREVDGFELRFYENSFHRPTETVWHGTEPLPAERNGLPVVYMGGGAYEHRLMFFTLQDEYDPDTDSLVMELTSVAGQEAVFVHQFRSGHTIGACQASATIPAQTDPTEPALLVFERDGNPQTELFSEQGTLLISRKVPDMDIVFYDDNRLWGCRGSEMWASKLGDPQNFFHFDGTADDSWNLAVNSPGDFTGGISHDGYPTFWKEKKRYKIYGSRPEGYQVTELDCEGVKKGAGESLAIVDGILYYLSRKGVMADNGAKPRLCSEALGVRDFGESVRATAGADERFYRISIFTPGAYETFVYDTRCNVWIREGGRVYDGYASVGHMMYGFRQFRIYNFGRNEEDWEIEAETDYNVTAVTNDYVAGAAYRQAAYAQGTPNRKALYRVQLRGTIEEGKVLHIMIRYDSSTTTKQVKTITGTGRKRSWYLPVHIRRCDHFRLIFSGTGWTLQSLALDYRTGSAIH